MAEKRMQITLLLTVADLDATSRKELAAEIDCKASELPKLKDVSAEDIAELFDGSKQFINDELFAGSGIYAEVTECRVIETTGWL